MERFLDHIEQPFAVQRFAEEGDSAALKGQRAHLVVFVSGHKDDWETIVSCTEIGLKLQATSARQMDVEDQAVAVVGTAGLQESFGGGKRLDNVSGRFAEPSQRSPH